MAFPVPRLSPLLAPRSVAIVGASPRENTLGNNVVVNLRRFGYAGRILPVHPSAPEVAGLPAYRGFDELPEPTECAVLAVPADKIAGALEEGAVHGLRAAVVFASGYSRSLARKGAHVNASCKRSAPARGSRCAGRTASVSSTCTSACLSTARAYPRG